MQRVQDVLMQSPIEIMKEMYTAYHQASISLYFMKIMTRDEKVKI